MRIGQLSKEFNIDTRTIDYYSNMAKILPYKTIPGSNYRDYDDESVDTLWKILIFRDLGLSIDETRKALADPSYFTIERLEDHIFQLEKHKEEQINKYDGMIKFAKQMKDTAMIPLHMVKFYKEIPSVKRLTEMLSLGIETMKGLEEEDRFSDDVAELGDLISATLSALRKNRNQGYDSEKVQRIIDRVINRLDKYIGSVCYIGYKAFSNLETDVWGIEEECGLGSFEFMKQVFNICAEWCLIAKTKEQILDFKAFRESFGDQIRQLDEQYHKMEICDDVSKSVYDDIVDLIQFELSQGHCIKDYLEGVVSGIAFHTKFVHELDEEYGEGFASFLSQALKYYSDQQD